MIQCPNCGSNLDEGLVCKACEQKFSVIDDVYFLFDSKISEKEWKWDTRILSREFRQDLQTAYRNSLSDEVKEAQEVWWQVAEKKLSEISGVVVDVATGLGTMLEKIITLPVKMIISTDVDPNVLLSTKTELDERFDRKAIYVASDAKHMAIKDNSADYVVSFAGTNNIPEPAKALHEFYRILKPGGKIVLMSVFVDEGTPTDMATKERDIDVAYVKLRFENALKSVGFRNLEITEASKAIWNENEMDSFPIAGDVVHYSIVEAQK